ncbi:PIG-L deacetylase family protein [Cryptosporangium sp. NPDC051539]|uniref:PIG-L deacetylase family protein n=1 Tax=Cryptosporangium sp. NPDC051539 TaxID=3363962 RepID=UPI0037AA21FC
MRRPRTIVAFHAHPDDEALLTGGTLARATAGGHRVVLVVATSGEAGLAAPTAGPATNGAGPAVNGAGPATAGAGTATNDAGPATDGTRPAAGGGGLGDRRQRELLAAAAALGCARVETLGYADSGLHGDAPGARRFCDVPVDTAAARLAALLLDERADVLLSYDARGGYGHPDHVQVHRVGARAGELAGVRVLEATIDRDTLRPLLRLLRFAGRLLPTLPLGGVQTVFTERAEITHVIDVRAYLGPKRAALAAHASQTEGGLRTVGALLRLPSRAFAVVAGREWFVERGRTPQPAPLTDLFAGT